MSHDRIYATGNQDNNVVFKENNYDPNTRMEPDDAILELNEYAVHDFLCTGAEALIRNLLPPTFDTDPIDIHQCLQNIKIRPTDPNCLTADQITEWEGKLRNLIDQISELDSEWHDIAEHTC